MRYLARINADTVTFVVDEDLDPETIEWDGLVPDCHNCSGREFRVDVQGGYAYHVVCKTCFEFWSVERTDTKSPAKQSRKAIPVRDPDIEGETVSKKSKKTETALDKTLDDVKAKAGKPKTAKVVKTAKKVAKEPKADNTKLVFKAEVAKESSTIHEVAALFGKGKTVDTVIEDALVSFEPKRGAKVSRSFMTYYIAQAKKAGALVEA